MAQLVESMDPGASFSCIKTKREIMVARVSLICTIICFNIWFIWNHTRFGLLKTCKPYFFHSYGQFMYAIHLYDRLRYSCNHTLPYMTEYLFAVSCMGDQLGLWWMEKLIVRRINGAWYQMRVVLWVTNRPSQTISILGIMKGSLMLWSINMSWK